MFSTLYGYQWCSCLQDDTLCTNIELVIYKRKIYSSIQSLRHFERALNKWIIINNYWLLTTFTLKDIFYFRDQPHDVKNPRFVHFSFLAAPSTYWLYTIFPHSAFHLKIDDSFSIFCYCHYEASFPYLAFLHFAILNLLLFRQISLC